eukprot:gene1495-1834_t
MVFTPLSAAAGGAILGVAAIGKFLLTGRILGISGAFKGWCRGDRSLWRAAFVAGLAGGSMVASHYLPGAFEALPDSFSMTRVAVGGLLVGLGASIANGCTSGHGICGNARLSKRSMLNTLTFMATGAAAATLTGTAAATGVLTNVAPALKLQQPEAMSKFAALVAAAAAVFGSLAFASKVGKTSATAGSSDSSQTSLELLSEAAVGAFFALGLALSGMTQPSKVAAFLSPTLAAWDASLMFVMGSALLVATPVFQAVSRGWVGQQPLLTAQYNLPTNSSVDAKLLAGGALFGVGWGLTGMCPGPALVSLARPAAKNVVFVASMLLGMLVDAKILTGSCW